METYESESHSHPEPSNTSKTTTTTSPTSSTTTFRRSDDSFTTNLRKEYEKGSFNDVSIFCSSGSSISVPSCLLASISPIFKSSCSSFSSSCLPTSIILPDIQTYDLETFLSHVWRKSENSYYSLDEDSSSLCRVLDVLCMDLSLPPESIPKKRGRKKGVKSSSSLTSVLKEPYVKSEIIDTPRSDVGYALRRLRKRTTFADEVSEKENDETFDETSRDFEETGKAFESKYEELSSSDKSEYEPNDDESEDDEWEDEEIDDESEEESFKEKEEMEPDFENDDDDEDEEMNYEEESHIYNEGEKFECSSSSTSTTTLLTLNVDENGEVVVLNETKDLNSFCSPSSSSSSMNIIQRSNGQQFTTSGCNRNKSFNCYLCPNTFDKISKLRHHYASLHSGSKYFTLPSNNPHVNCFECSLLMASYETMIRESPLLKLANIVFPCPHCRKRFRGHPSALFSHLLSHHSEYISLDSEGNENSYYSALSISDERVLICEFCDKEHQSLSAINSHLLSCIHNDTSYALRLRCKSCGKTFVSNKGLQRHILRHEKKKSHEFPRDFPCKFCPLTSSTQAHYKRHLERDHSQVTEDPDDIFTLHSNCDKCSRLQRSYMENKNTGNIPYSQIVFKCPHCKVLLYAHAKHAPRYIYNHVNTFHSEYNVRSLEQIDDEDNENNNENENNNGNENNHGEEEEEEKHVLLSKSQPDLFVCDFCQVRSRSRLSHNAHILSCSLNNDPIRPGYLCNSCGFISVTSLKALAHINRCHLSFDKYENEGVVRPSYSCALCSFVSMSEVSLFSHVKRTHEFRGLKSKISSDDDDHRRRRRHHHRRHYHRRSGRGSVSGRGSLRGRRRRGRGGGGGQSEDISVKGNYLPCPTCGKLRKDGSSLASHIKKCGIGPSKVSCSSCDMDFKHSEDMEAHALIHLGQVTCPIHNILFKNENEIYHHVNKASYSDKIPLLSCCMCDKVFRHMCIFMKHLRRHLRISPYRCSLCHKTVQSYSSLQLHKKRLHDLENGSYNNTNKSSSSCELLDTSATLHSLSSSNSHSTKDFGVEKDSNYKCEYCSKTFTTKGHLKEHIGGVHERYNNVFCPVCHKSFNTQKRMKKHLFATHKELADQFRSHHKVEAYAGLSIKI